MASVSAIQEYRVQFSGRVQGVGFRFTARHLARQFKNLTGYASNLPDGRVEIVVESDVLTFRDFLRSIEESPLGRGVTETKVETRPITARQFTSFDIHA